MLDEGEELVSSEIQLERSNKFWCALHSRATNRSIVCCVSNNAERKSSSVSPQKK